VLAQLRDGQLQLLDRLVEIVWQIDLNPWHAPTVRL
jgi:hypothetical protein